MRAVKYHQSTGSLFPRDCVIKTVKKTHNADGLAVTAKALSRAIYSKSDGFSRASALSAFVTVKAKKR